MATQTSTENAVAGPSTQTQTTVQGYHYEEDAEEPAHPQKRYYFYVPSTILASTPMAAAIGFILGARRGAVKARLRFLAENAHRQPTTVQGWVSWTGRWWREGNALVAGLELRNRRMGEWKLATRS